MTKSDDEQVASRASNDGYSRLMAGILLQAAIDAKASKDAALKLEALTWLASEDAGAMCEALDVPDVFTAILTGSKAPPARGWRVNSRIKRRV